MMRWMILVVGVLSVFGAKAQDKTYVPGGAAWVSWGYNRSIYTLSDIHLTGPGYDFTLHDVQAHDDPEEFDAKVYLNPLKLTIPQFNFRMGYQMNKKWGFSLGWDHMKYVVRNVSEARITGNIDPSISTIYGGSYNNETIKLTKNFFQMEHTDGLNYVRFNLDRFDQLLGTLDGKHGILSHVGVGVGGMLPWTDSVILGKYARTKPHFAGVGMSINAGFRGVFWHHFFIQSTVMGGAVFMPDVTTTLETDRASQNFRFAEFHTMIGVYFDIKKDDCSTCPVFD